MFSKTLKRKKLHCEIGEIKSFLLRGVHIWGHEAKKCTYLSLKRRWKKIVSAAIVYEKVQVFVNRFVVTASRVIEGQFVLLLIRFHEIFSAGETKSMKSVICSGSYFTQKNDFTKSFANSVKDDVISRSVRKRFLEIHSNRGRSDSRKIDFSRKNWRFSPATS